MIQLVRIIISFNRYQNVGNNIYIRSMTLWSLMTNLADVIKYVPEYYIFGQGNVRYFKRCSFLQIHLVRRLKWWRKSLGELEHLELQNQRLVSFQ